MPPSLSNELLATVVAILTVLVSVVRLYLYLRRKRPSAPEPRRATQVNSQTRGLNQQIFVNGNVEKMDVKTEYREHRK